MSIAESSLAARPTTTPGRAASTEQLELFVVYASTDAAFVREYLLPAIDVPRSSVLLIDELPLGGLVISEIDRAVSRSRYTVVVLSPAYLESCWSVFGEQLASYLSMNDVRVIPLRLIDCKLPSRLQARIALDFTDKARWDWEVARLCAVLRTSAPATEQIRYPHRRVRVRRRWLLGILGSAATSASLVYAGPVLWHRPTTESTPPRMVRFDDTTMRLGVFATSSRPQECNTLTPEEDCAVLESPENVGRTQVGSFELDRLEVSNGEYATWLNANTELWKLVPHGIVTTRREPAIPLIRTELCSDGLTISSENRACLSHAGNRPLAGCMCVVVRRERVLSRAGKAPTTRQGVGARCQRRRGEAIPMGYQSANARWRRVRASH